MKIGKETYVSLTYELRLDNKKNEIIDKATEKNPLDFTWGIGMMLPKFELNIENLSENDTFEFSLLPTEAYGETREELIADVSIELFKNNNVINYDILKINNVIPVTMQDGHVMNGLIVSFNDETVRMDFNHPLAGKNLYFTGKILQVRKATEEEMNVGHHDCGGNCDGHGCGGGDCHNHEDGDNHDCCCDH